MKTPITIIFIIVCFLEFKAQHFTHDIGGFVGFSSLQTDYVQSENFGSELNNKSMSFAAVHYLSFFNKSLRWNPNNSIKDHLMVRTELQYVNNTELRHHGKYANQKSPNGQKLSSMSGSVKMLNIGIHLEYFLKSLEEFVFPHSKMLFNPFVSLGMQYSFFNNNLTSSLGDWRTDITVLPDKYSAENAINIGNGESLAFNFGFGSRYKVSKKMDLIAQFNYQYFFNDNIDGLQSNTIDNKSNETSLSMQLGLIYHLNFRSPLF